MPHDVFVSYSTKDKTAVDALCEAVEAQGVRCWVAHRDIEPMADWADSITTAIEASQILVLVVSAFSNASKQVHREVYLADRHGIPVLAVRIADVDLARNLAYFLTSVQYLDAVAPPFEKHLPRLAAAVRKVLGAADLPSRPAAKPEAPAWARTPSPSEATAAPRASPLTPASAAPPVPAPASVVAPAGDKTDRGVATLRDLFLAGRLAAEQFDVGRRLLGVTVRELSQYDAERLSEFLAVVDGRRAPEDLAAALERIETPQQRDARLARQAAAAVAAAERQAREASRKNPGAAAIAPNIWTFQTFPNVPEPLTPLLELAHNLWWAWNPDAVELFRRLDRRLWEDVYHDPVKMLGLVDAVKLAAAGRDKAYLAHVKRVHAAFQAHMQGQSWFKEAHPGKARLRVAYFSAEFGLHESLPIYSGGLGILAGDHLKSASELGVPLVAVGLLYRNGYFRQYLSADGWQQENYPDLDFYNLPVEPCRAADHTQVRVRVDLPDGAVFCNVWRANVGRITLYLLDTNLTANAPADRDITAHLYGSGNDLRIKQEIVLGIGGVRALTALGIEPTVFHMNEGHTAFLALERIRVILQEEPELTFDQARQIVMATNVFTTHTPVPAGIDFFAPEVMAKYFRGYWPALKLDEEGFLALGREDPANKRQGFSMAVLAIRLADHVNGVSALHGDVSRKMWHNLWPQVPPDEVPIRHITNGVHLRSWLSQDVQQTLDRYFREGWVDRPADWDVWNDIQEVPDEEIWRAHERCRARLVSWVRTMRWEQLARRGASHEEVMQAKRVLNADSLTIGFAHSFATYERGTLLLRDVPRLKRLLEDTKRPVQFVFAGKAHPADHEGKELIKALIHFARDPAVRRRVVFVENYDISVARYLVQGVDVWLNTPRRPYEASGTSGMKAAANGVLNCSILDGWWVEGYGPDVGWAIGRGENYPDPGQQDEQDSQALFDVLEQQIIPMFYDRDLDDVPRDWVARMKTCIRKLAPVFNTNRMVRDYTEMFYAPAVVRGDALAADGMARAITLASAKDRLRRQWPGIRFLGVHTSGDGHFLVGEVMQVEALVDMPGVDPKDVTVQLYAGPINSRGEIEQPQAVAMYHAKTLAPDRYLYVGKIDCRRTGRQSFALRILPGHPDLATPFEPGLITWN